MHVCKWFAQLLAATITNVDLKSYMFTVLVLKRTELHSFYIYIFFVCVGLSSRISSDPHSLWLQLHGLLFNPNRIRVLFNAGKKQYILTLLGTPYQYWIGLPFAFRTTSFFVAYSQQLFLQIYWLKFPPKPIWFELCDMVLYPAGSGHPKISTLRS